MKESIKSEEDYIQKGDSYKNMIDDKKNKISPPKNG